jgi:hypothetical protein
VAGSPIASESPGRSFRGALTEPLGGADPKKAQAVMSAMLRMGKIEIAGLQDAYEAA